MDKSVRIITRKITQKELGAFCEVFFKTFVKFVADVNKNILAVGGELHTDAEMLLLENDSMQSDLWGGNFFPWKTVPDRLEFTSFINIRPRDNNADMAVLDEKLRERIRVLCGELLLSDDETMAVPEPRR
jgi:hypothetical protein